jgi:hypothetical protein
MRLRRRKDVPEEGAESVVRDAEGDPVENPTVSGILPPLESAAQHGDEAIPPPPPPPPPAFAPEAPVGVVPDHTEVPPPPAEPETLEPPPIPGEPATVVAEVPAPEPAPFPEPIPGPEPIPEPDPEPPVPEPQPEPEPVIAEPAPPAPEAEPAPFAPEPETVGRDLTVSERRGFGRPELLVGAAFAGGVAVAIVLRRLGRR